MMVETGSPASTYHSMHATVLQDIIYTQVECRLELIALIQVSRAVTTNLCTSML